MSTRTADDAALPPDSGHGARATLDAEAVATRLAGLHADWKLDAGATSISRRFACDTFAAAVQLANLAAWHAEKQNHHPDVTFGWGYCTVRYTSHDVGGLSDRDFSCAATLDALVA
jgi:4a-hydroxytetrahydrobiopterin dehydratase